jgi:glutamyl-tRNA reductase
MSELLALGISHKTAPVELRERLALTDGQAERALRDFVGHEAIHEAVAISTCNRTEVYLAVGDPVEAESAALAKLAKLAGIRPTELAGAIYSPRNCDAARHLYRVTSGLDSMILGEAEVQGQVRRAFERARAAGVTGPLTNRLFQAALTTGKRVRSETALGSGSESVSSVAAQLAEETCGGLEDRQVVIIGAGETAELTARALAERGVRTVFVANRRHDRAHSLAQRFGGEAIGFDALPDTLEIADVVVSATSSPHAIVGDEELAVVMAARGGRPLLLVDIAVPRDVDPGCAAIEGVTLYDIDDLQAVIKRNRHGRRADARRAEAIVEDEIQRFASWLGTLEALPTVAALREHGDQIAAQVLAENAGRWETASDRDLERIEAIAGAIVSRLLHEPTVRLKRAGEQARHARIHVLRELFGLEEGPGGEDAADAPVSDGRPARSASVHRLERR